MHISHAADDYFKCLMRRYFENYAWSFGACSQLPLVPWQLTLALCFRRWIFNYEFNLHGIRTLTQSSIEMSEWLQKIFSHVLVAYFSSWDSWWRKIFSSYLKLLEDDWGVLGKLKIACLIYSLNSMIILGTFSPTL